MSSLIALKNANTMKSCKNFEISQFGTGSISQYISFVNSIPLLSEDEEKSLISDFRLGNQIAGKKVAEAHLRVVVRIALEFQKYHSNLWDIISEGNIGLLKALKNFSLEKNVKFVTYANLWIKASIQEFILKSSSILKISIGLSQKKILFNLGKVKAKLKKIHGEAITTKQIANALNVEESDVIDISNSLNNQSLDVQSSQDSTQTIQDITPSQILNPEENFIINQNIKQDQNTIKQALQNLNERESCIIKKRFLTKKTSTLLELSKEFNISVERVRQIEAEALKKMRKAMLSIFAS